LLQSYDSAAGTAQRLQEHDRMMSDLCVLCDCSQMTAMMTEMMTAMMTEMMTAMVAAMIACVAA
jgi:hypothetical protein